MFNAKPEHKCRPQKARRIGRADSPKRPAPPVSQDLWTNPDGSRVSDAAVLEKLPPQGLTWFAHPVYFMHRMNEAGLLFNPEPVFFGQREGKFVGEFTDSFTDSACAATALLNVISVEYTEQTGLTMDIDLGLAALKEAVKNNKINSQTISPYARVNDWAGAATCMWDLVRQHSPSTPSGTWTFTASGGKHVIYSIYDQTRSPPTHFVNCIGGGHYFDPWDKKTNRYVIDLVLEVASESPFKWGPTRTFTFVKN